MKHVKKIYFVGIKGVGMGALATLVSEAGFTVGGSDVAEEFVTDKELSYSHIIPDVGFSEASLTLFTNGSKKEEILVVTTAAHGGLSNTQVTQAKKLGFSVITYAQAVGMFMDGGILGRSELEGISVAASHGKTTIASMLACFFTKLGMDPSYVVGTGEIFPIGNAGHYGKGNYFIAEADEYVSDPQHDLTPKFLYQKPFFAIFNNIDFDHPDVFENIQRIEEAFFSFTKNIIPGGILLLNGDDERLMKIKKRVDTNVKVLTYGSGPANDFCMIKYEQNGFTSHFTVDAHNVSLGEFTLSVPGFHNAKNCLSVIALLSELGTSFSDIKKVLPTFLGTKRRLELVGRTDQGAVIIDDYAHHPEEIRTTLSALKKAYPGKRVICIFQPHTYTRTKALLYDFVASFSDADVLLLLPVFRSAREGIADQSIDTHIAEEFLNLNKKVITVDRIAPPETLSSVSHFKDFVVEYVNQSYRTDSYVIITMGAGDVYKVSKALSLRETSAKLKAQNSKL